MTPVPVVHFPKTPRPARPYVRVHHQRPWVIVDMRFSGTVHATRRHCSQTVLGTSKSELEREIASFTKSAGRSGVEIVIHVPRSNGNAVL